MKQTLPALFALSLLANLALAIILIRANTPPAPAGNPAATAPRAASIKDSAIAAAMKTGDPAALLAQLKAAGISDKTARYIAASLELQKFVDQMTELSPPQPYWDKRSQETPEDRLKMRQIESRFQATVTDLLGDAIPQIGNQRYAYLTPERRAELRRLEKDYDDLQAEMLTSTGNFRLQSDTDNLQALATERKREIEQFFTPDELSARDLRESPAARLVRSDYGNIIETEAEYKTIHAALQAAGDDPAAQAAARAQIESTLGPDRMAKLAQLNDPDYNLIQAAATRLNLPHAETTQALTAIRAEAQQSSAAIIADHTLTSAQRKTALQAIAEKSRAQMDPILGSEGVETYAKRASWMNALKNGNSFTIDERGKFKTNR